MEAWVNEQGVRLKGLMGFQHASPKGTLDGILDKLGAQTRGSGKRLFLVSADEAVTIPGEGELMANLAGVVQQLRKERDQAARVVERLDAALAALNGGSYRKRTGNRRHLSAAARARIAAAQRARWAKVRRNGGQKHNVVSMPKKKTMSAAARKKIAAAQRARWAKVKAAQKKTA